MLVLDGNNSLKRMKTAGGQRVVGDTRELVDSDYFLSNAFVNTFADEVQRRTTETSVKEEPDEEIHDDNDGYVTDAQASKLENCATNWKAAASKEKKRMWGVFDETGVFASACPHGLVLWLVDMIQSGELYLWSFSLCCGCNADETFQGKVSSGHGIKSSGSLRRATPYRLRHRLRIRGYDSLHFAWDQIPEFWFSNLCQRIPWILPQLRVSMQEPPK